MCSQRLRCGFLLTPCVLEVGGYIQSATCSQTCGPTSVLRLTEHGAHEPLACRWSHCWSRSCRAFWLQPQEQIHDPKDILWCQNIVTGMSDQTSPSTSILALTYFLQADVLFEALTDKLVPALADSGMSQTCWTQPWQMMNHTTFTRQICRATGRNLINKGFWWLEGLLHPVTLCAA